jgi:hypothetical protein
MDKPLEMGWRKSLNDVPNFRLQSQTQEREWTFDIYAGDYLVVSVGDRLTEVCHSVPSAITYLCRMLGVSPNK